MFAEWIIEGGPKRELLRLIDHIFKTFQLIGRHYFETVAFQTRPSTLFSSFFK